jgi:hypothetical protein
MQCLFSSIHIFIKLRALSIQQYDVEIKLEKKDIENADNAISEDKEDSNEIAMAEVMNIDKCEEELDLYRQSIEEM